MHMKNKTFDRARTEIEEQQARWDDEVTLDFSYTGLANRAAEAERQGNFVEAEGLWRKACMHAKRDENCAWAKSRMLFCAKAKLRPRLPAEQAA